MAGNYVQLGRQAEHSEAGGRMLISLNSKSRPVGKLDIYLLRDSAHIQSKATTAMRETWTWNQRMIQSDPIWFFTFFFFFFYRCCVSMPLSCLSVVVCLLLDQASVKTLNCLMCLSWRSIPVLISCHTVSIITQSTYVALDSTAHISGRTNSIRLIWPICCTTSIYFCYLYIFLLKFSFEK